MTPELERNAHVSFSISKFSVVEEKDVFTYDLNSFVADFGGYLGLLLGMSLLSIFDLGWDLVEAGIAKKKKKKNGDKSTAQLT